MTDQEAIARLEAHEANQRKWGADPAQTKRLSQHVLVTGWNLTNEQKEAMRQAAAEDYAQRLADGFEAFEDDEIVRADEMV